MRTLTTQQKEVCEKWLAVGEDPTARITAVQEVYNTKTRESAQSLYSQLKKNPRVAEYISERESAYKQVLAAKAPTIKQLIQDRIPIEKRVETCKKILEEASPREKIEVLKYLSAIIGDYAPTKNVNFDMDLRDGRRDICEPDDFEVRP